MEAAAATVDWQEVSEEERGDGIGATAGKPDVSAPHPSPRESERVGHPASIGERVGGTSPRRMGGALVIDVPMRWGPGLVAPVDEELQAERCSYIRAGDRKCGARAVEDGMCTVHARWSRWAESNWPMTCPEDRESVAEAMRQTLSWMIAGHITEKQALVIVAICRAILRTV